MNRVKELSKQAGNYMKTYSNDPYASEKISYIIERLSYNLIYISILFAIAYYLKIHFVVLVFLATFIAIRGRFGGFHVKSESICLILSILIPLILGYIAGIINISVISLIIIYIFAYAIAVKVGVVDNPNKRLKEERKAKFKRQGLIVLTLILIINIYTYLNGFTEASNAIAYGIIVGFSNLLIKNE